jgi:hypothetical protein
VGQFKKQFINFNAVKKRSNNKSTAEESFVDLRETFKEKLVKDEETLD